MADLRDDPVLRAEIQAAVDDANTAVSHAEAIKKFSILGEDFTEADRRLRAQPHAGPAPRKAACAAAEAEIR